MNRGTSSRATRIVGIGALVASAFTVWLGLWVTPPSTNMGELVRLLYVHPTVATICYLAFGVTALASLAYLWPRTRSRRWDLLAGASAELGVVFCALTLATGSIWGRPTWGVWWAWDARLTLTALLLVLFLGYLALRRAGGDFATRAKRNAIAAVSFALVVPVDHFATSWWRTLHQGDTLGANLQVHGSMLWTLMLSFGAFGLIYTWLLIHRYRVERLEDRFETEGLTRAIEARRAEAGIVPAAAGTAGTPAPGGTPATGGALGDSESDPAGAVLR